MDQRTDIQALIEALREQTKAISAFSLSVMELAIAIHKLVDEEEEDWKQTDLSGRPIS